jgi:uncharacterized membrane protein
MAFLRYSDMEMSSSVAKQSSASSTSVYQRRAHLLLWVTGGLAVLLLGARFLQTRSLGYSFLAWNLFLAWIPFEVSRWIARMPLESRLERVKLLPFFLLWLLFFPNAPYILTDFVHVHHYDRHHLLEIALVGTHALCGLLLGLVSLRNVQLAVTRACGCLAGEATVVVSSLLAGLGIYCGRILGWNSWDVLTDPRLLFGKLFAALFNPRNHVGAIAFSAFFGAVLLFSYLAARRLILRTEA